MNETITFHKRYLKYAKATNPWELGNQVLYDLCSKFPSHKNDSEIIAKIWLIGRSYAASVERRKNKSNKDEDNEMFYENIVAPTMRKSKLDRYLSRINTEKRITKSNIGDILETHKYLVDLFESITKLNKRSLASKYLHFHYPHLFYIFDSRAVASLRKVIKAKTIKEDSLICDSQYASFFRKAFTLNNYIEDNHKVHLSPRELDKILLWIY